MKASLTMGVALMAWVSLLPYFMWGRQKVFYAAVTLLIVMSAAACYRALLAERSRWPLSAAFALFLVYLSLLPKVDGSMTRWFFLIPFTAVLLQLGGDRIRAAFGTFYWIFCLSLVPAMLLWLWLVAGLPLEMRFTAPPGDIVQRGITEYVEFPGAVFLMSNGVVLPNGGTLFRLCGMYDEPGTVGTIAALCLAADGFRLRRVPGAIAFAAGLMSFSIAFAVLAALGLVATSFARRRPVLLAALPAITLAAWLPLSGLRFEGAPPAHLTIAVPPDAGAAPLSAPEAPPAVVDIKPGQFTPAPQWRLRNSPFDSRVQPRMRRLIEQYLHSGPRVLAFGVASDASIVYGWGSSVWYRILTDFGIVGFLWVFALFAAPPFLLWRRGELGPGAVIFCALFLMSFYQRPIIWLPAQLLIYVAGTFGYRNPSGDHV